MSLEQFIKLQFRTTIFLIHLKRQRFLNFQFVRVVFTANIYIISAQPEVLQNIVSSSRLQKLIIYV